MSTKRRYTDDEVARILDYATEAERTRQAEPGTAAAPTRRDESDGMTLAELQDIGREVGISAELIAKAATAVDQGPLAAEPTRSLLGTPIAVGRTVELDRPLTDAEWDRLVVDLRETFNARGRIRQEGRFRQWTNGNLQALLEPTPTGERLRLHTLKSDARVTIGLGSTALLLAPLLFVLLSVFGDPGASDAIRIPVMMAVFGGFMFVRGKLTLPRWADTRALQMDGVATRLLAAIDTDAPPERLIEGTGDDDAR